MGLANPLHLVVLLIVLAFWLIPSWIIAMYAERKGHPFWGFLLIGLFFSWVVELIIALVIKDQREQPSVAQDPNSDLDRLERFADLYAKGALSREEFEDRKADVLGQRG